MDLNKKKIIRLLSSGLIILGIIAIFFIYYLFASLKLSSNYLIEIPTGQPATLIAQKLYTDKIIRSPKLFKLALIILNKDSKIQAGEYELLTNTSIFNLIKKISTGDVKKYSFRINEGETISSIAARLKQEQKLRLIITDTLVNPSLFIKTITEQKKFLNNNQDKLSLSIVDPEKVANLDGLLFPDTYFYKSQQADLELFSVAYMKLIATLNNLWEESIKIYPRDSAYFQAVNTPYQALILASILEKETADNNERKIVSGVIYNRLLRNMPLQVDPTVIYSLGDKYKGNLTKEDLSYDSPYNTYINKSLPPGPIGTVSLGSLRAAINPTKHEYYYFVSKGDGTHFFSKTLEEHNAAVKLYQKKV